MTKHRVRGLAEHYKLRVYKMLRVWQKKLLIQQQPIDLTFDTPASSTPLELDAGRYEVWLVGGGGGGAMYSTSNVGATKYYAMGGVGGVLHVIIYVPSRTTVSVIVGGNGKSGFRSNPYVLTTGGGYSSITGLTDATITAGGGSGAKITNASSYTPGVQGTNTATGINILSVIENNVNTIISGTDVSSASQKESTAIQNINYLPDTYKGRGGGFSWTSSTLTAQNGGPGFVRIKSVN